MFGSMLGSSLGGIIGDAIGQMIGDAEVGHASLVESRAEEIRDTIHLRVVGAGTAGGAVWGGMLGWLIDIERGH